MTAAAVRPDLDVLDPAVLTDLVHGQLRLGPEQALTLFQRMPIQELGRWADARCRFMHGDSIRTYVIDRNINYTNICTARCTFCAFRRDGDEDDAYTLDREVLLQKIQELTDIGGTQILMQGGMNPHLPLDWYTDLLHAIKERFPQVHIHAFSPPEFVEFVRFFDPPGAGLEDQLRWVMKKLRGAGLDSVPGGGGEIFAPAVRRKIGLGKCDAEQWLTVMRVAHELGMNTSATMMFGHIEGIADRIHHMDMVRRWQDRAIDDFAAEGGGRYMAFIAWPFQRENTPLGRAKEWGLGESDDVSQPFPGDVVARLDGSGEKESHPLFGRRVRMAGASDYLRTQAISRLYLDNVFSIGSSWVTMGPHTGQVALHYGASDMGSVMMEENVVSAAGTTYCLNEATICRLIRDAGFLPAQRNNQYNLLKVHDEADSPDLRVRDWSTLRVQRLHQQSEKAKNEAVGLTIAGAPSN
ncbi:MAG: radical SAM protein [Phycisphaerales bacterium]|nr:radical SAM protein [Phycisphaerales bacterium]MCI0631494.1 radical SAM protein [Phycisphaerales bacterium]MCI0677133.1 radical SAM protein [Phycisphaerales bacterium]